MNWKEKKFLVFGTGISGIAAAGLLRKENIEFIIYDGNEALTREQIREKSPAFLDVRILLGALTREAAKEVDIAILSPGVPSDAPEVELLRQEGVEIWGEIELAYVFSKGRVFAITGTNGKTTTTSLLGAVLREAFLDVKVVGNIGIPYTSIVAETGPDTVIAAEISSFQLETIHTFCPEVSAILNITPDHLNRHHTMENYQKTKEEITKNQTKGQTCVLNYEDPLLREFGGRIQADVFFFSSKRELSEGIYLKDGSIYYASDGTVERVCTTDELQVLGRHNHENVMAAAAMALKAGVPLKKVHDAVVRFEAVEHRIEYVAEKRGVRFYNDSKGTNPDAAIKAIQAMQWPTLLIGGGYDKGSSYEAWIKAFEGKVKKLVLLGATADKIAKAAEECGFLREDIVFAESLDEAVSVCYENAERGDAVLLSPACASWGMFKNYEERGNMFKKLVKELKE